MKCAVFSKKERKLSRRCFKVFPGAVVFLHPNFFQPTRGVDLRLSFPKRKNC